MTSTEQSEKLLGEVTFLGSYQGRGRVSRAELAAEVAAEIPGFVNATVLLQLAVADQLGVPAIDLHCLDLVGSGTATTPTQLAERLGLTTGAVTKMLDRMEAQRLVRRVPNPADRRGVLVEMRADRADELARLYAPMGEFLAAQMADGTDEQLAFLARFARESREAAMREATRLRREGRPHATRRTRPGTTAG
jgi:DNA-binding MarR family transcriptional regulator